MSHPTSDAMLNTVAAFEHNGQTVSRQQFYAVACDPQRSVAVEACAGAGKTWMLVSRIVRALLQGSAAHEILAITFTKKAASEMRQRLQDWLAQFAAAPSVTLRQELQNRGIAAPSEADEVALRGLHAKLLRHGRSVQIRTFHSWFSTLLRNAPLAVLHELGLPLHYDLLEDDKKAIVHVWPKFFARLLQDGPAQADYFAAVASSGRYNVQKALEAALAKRTEFALADQAGVVAASVTHFSALFPTYAGLESPIAYLQTKAAQTLLWAAAAVLGADKGKKAQQAATDLELALTEFTHVSAAQNAADAQSIFDALLTKIGGLRKFGAKLADDAQLQAAQNLLLQLRQAQHQHEAWLHQQRMARLARGLLADYAALKRERGWIDMNDLERAALVLMSNAQLSGWVQERLDARVRHLLVDEFQDTNPLQWHILREWLAAYTGAGLAPSVFIVGDPKQSIYRFRRAEPQVFRAAKQFIKEGLAGDVLSCDHTHRNASAIVQLVNSVMLEAQGSGGYEGYRSHSTESSEVGAIYKLPPIGLTGVAVSAQEASDAAEAGDAAPSESMSSAVDAQADAPPPPPPPPAEWRDSLQTPRVEAEEGRKLLECRQVAQWLAQHLNSTPSTPSALQPSDVMVLCRKREPLSSMQAELTALHIPAQQPEKTNLADYPEVQDMVALLDVLVSAGHDLSLARVLKSPLFGVSDADLVQLVVCKKNLQAARQKDGASADTNPLTWLAVMQQAAQDLPACLVQAAATLRQWRQWVNRRTPHDALSAIYQHGDVLARFAAAAPAQLRESVVANLHALLGAALEMDGGRYSTAYALVRALRAGAVQAPLRAQTDAVRLLTVHGAKGLEAKLVVLLDTDAKPPAAQTFGVLVDWPGEQPHPQRFVFLTSESNPPLCAQETLQREVAARQREELNALYVALTRAKQTLLFSSAQARQPDPNSWWRRLQHHASPIAPVPEADTQYLPAESALVAETVTLKVLPTLQRPAGSAVDAEATARSSHGTSDASDNMNDNMHHNMNDGSEGSATDRDIELHSYWLTDDQNDDQDYGQDHA